MFKSVFSEMFVKTVVRILVIAIAAALGPLLYRLLFGGRKNSGKTPNSNITVLIGTLGFFLIMLVIASVYDVLSGSFDPGEPVFLVCVAIIALVLFIMKRKGEKQGKEDAEASADGLPPEEPVDDSVSPAQDTGTEQSSKDG